MYTTDLPSVQPLWLQADGATKQVDLQYNRGQQAELRASAVRLSSSVDFKLCDAKLWSHKAAGSDDSACEGASGVEGWFAKTACSSRQCAQRRCLLAGSACGAVQQHSADPELFRLLPPSALDNADLAPHPCWVRSGLEDATKAASDVPGGVRVSDSVSGSLFAVRVRASYGAVDVYTATGPGVGRRVGDLRREVAMAIESGPNANVLVPRFDKQLRLSFAQSAQVTRVEVYASKPGLKARAGHCPDGYAPITSKAECEATASLLQLKDVTVDPADTFATATSTRPEGCYWNERHGNAPRLAFNEGGFDPTANDGQRFAICKSIDALANAIDAYRAVVRVQMKASAGVVTSPMVATTDGNGKSFVWAPNGTGTLVVSMHILIQNCIGTT